MHLRFKRYRKRFISKQRRFTIKHAFSNIVIILLAVNRQTPFSTAIHL